MDRNEEKEPLKEVFIKGLIIGIIVLAVFLFIYFIVPALFVGLSLSGWE